MIELSVWGLTLMLACWVGFMIGRGHGRSERRAPPRWWCIPGLRGVVRTSDFSLELTFHSCRQASAVNRRLLAGEEE